MAGAGYRTFQSGEVLTSNNVQTYLMDQAVQVYAGTAERGSAIPTPSTGMVAYSTATGLQVFDGSDWVDAGGAAQDAITVDFLVLAAGGGGGGNGGGGGGGGVRSSVTNTGGGGSVESAQSLFTNNDYPIIVGAGGAGGTAVGGAATVRAVNGGLSQFNTIVANGGGAGAGWTVFPLQDGGSGGGAFGSTIGLGTTNQGFNGGTGTGSTAANQGYGGGGGGGGVGSNGAVGTGGNGGVGVASSITGSSVTYSGGGGGSCNASGTGGTGGSSNGGNGSTTGNGTNGTVNRGGGGGAAGNAGGTTTAGNGSSGVVILRYADTLTITIGTGLTGTESAASGGYKRATITAGTGSVRWS